MALWAGATQYIRIFDATHREVWVVQGFGINDLQFCWKPKRDMASNKTFFVNLAGLGKKWRLPDIYDEKNLYLLEGRPIEEVKKISSSGQVSRQPPTPPEKVASYIIEETFSPPGNASGQGLINYDDDSWNAMLGSTGRSVQSKKAPAPKNDVLTSYLEEEDHNIEHFLRGDATAGDEHLLPPIVVDHQAAHMSPERAEAENQIVEEMVRRQIAQQERLAEAQRSSSQLERERQSREAAHAAEQSALNELENLQRTVAQQDAKQALASAGLDPQDFKLVVHDPISSVLSNISRSPSAAGARGGMEGAAGTFIPHEAWTAVLEQLRYHQEEGVKLRGEIEERERMLNEHRLADVERERREVTLRIRMLESMVAYRNRLGVIETELGGKLDITATSPHYQTAHAAAIDLRQRESTSPGRRGGSSSIPRHPLMEHDFQLDDDDIV